MPRHLSPPVLVCLAVALLGSFITQASTPAGQGARAPTVAPRTATLKGEAIPLGQALADLSKQTGIPVRDRRSAKIDPKLTLALDRTPFWLALDALARQAGAGISLYQADGSIALVDTPAHPLAASYSGVFRSAVKRLTLSRDLETDAHTCVASLEIAWEPWFQPFLLEVKSYTATFGEKSSPVTRQGTGQVPVNGRTFIEVELPLPAPDRILPAITGLKGNFTVIGPTTMHTVRFTGLNAAAKDGKPRTETPEKGIRVTLRRLTVVDTDRWEVEMALAYPPGGPPFESFQSWLVNNRIYLEKGNQRSAPRLADERIVSLSPSRAVIQYYFVEEPGKRQRLGSPGDWTLVYVTPGRIVEVPAAFELKNLPLP